MNKPVKKQDSPLLKYITEARALLQSAYDACPVQTKMAIAEQMIVANVLLSKIEIDSRPDSKAT